MINPRRVRGEQLHAQGPRPGRQAFVVFARGRHLPAHDEEHDVQHGDALGQAREVGELGEDVGKDA